MSLLLLVAGGRAQAEPDYGRIQVFRPGEEVLALAQTNEGLIWIGTNSGLLRFDGHEFRWVDVGQGPRRAVTALLASPDGALWVGQDGMPAVTRLHGDERRSWGEAEGISAGRIRTIIGAADGGVLVGGDGGGWSFAMDGAVTRLPWLPAGRSIRSLYRRPSGGFWVGTDVELARVTGGRFEPVLSKGAVNSILEVGSNQVLIAVGSRGPLAGLYAVTIGPDEGGRVNVTRGERVYHDRIVRTFATPPAGEGGAWVGTSNGVLHVDAAGVTQHTEPLPPLAPSRVINALLPDQEGGLWLGTQLGLLRAPRPLPFRVVSIEARRQLVSVLADPDGSVWMLGTNSLMRYRDNAIVEEIEVDDVPEGSEGLVSLVRGDDGTLWVGTSAQGLLRYEAGKLVRVPLTLPAGIPDGRARPLHWSSRRGLLISVGPTGLAALKGGQVTVETFDDVGVRSEVVAAAEDAAGTLWVATDRHGLVRLTGDQRQRWGRKEGLPSENLSGLAIRGDGLLIGSRDAGLIVGGGKDFVAVGRREGLGTDSIAGVVRDGRGYVWLTTIGDGVVRVRESELDSFAAGTIKGVRARVLTARDGMPSNSSRTRSGPSGTIDSRGHLWLALFRGAVVFSMPAGLPVPRLPQPVLDVVRIDGRALPLKGPTPHVPLGHGLFDARYTAAFFEGREHLAFRYRLDGVDRDWREAGDRQEVVYAGLGPGTYRFRVVPSFPDAPELVTVPEATLAFVLIPPFHRTGTFYALMVIMLILAATGAIVLRLRVIRRRLAIIAEERDRIAREIHDSLEQTLYAAQMQIDAAGEDPLPT
ncbi:MAG TPA: histidine kinase, partial [Polyangia bacterium]